MQLPHQTPAELLAAAGNQGLDEALDAPLMDWIQASALSPRPRGVVQALAVAQALATPRRLLQSTRIWQALGGSITPAVLDDLADWLVRRNTPSLRPAGPAPGISHASLRLWAGERNIAADLDRPAKVLDERVVGRARYWFWQRPSATIAEALTAPAGQRGTDAVPVEIQEAAADWLAERAERAARALLDEGSFLAALTPPEAPALRALWDRVMAERALLRAVSLPAPRDELSRARISAYDDPPRWTLRDTWHGVCGNTPNGQVTIDLQPGDRPFVTCLCPSGKARCPLGILALDSLALALSSPSQESNPWLVQAVGREPWERALEDLASVEPNEPVLLGWRYDTDKNRFVPLSCTPKKRGSGWKMAKVPLEELAMHPEWATTAGDREARDLVLAAGDAPAPWVASAVASRLVGHPRVVVDATPTEILRRTLHVEWTPVPEGVQAAVHVGDYSIQPGGLAPLLRAGRASGHALLLLPNEPLFVVPVPAALLRVVEALVRRGTRLPTAAIEPLLDQLPALAADIRLAPELRGEVRPGDDTPVIRIDTSSSGGFTVTVVIRPMYQGPAFPPGEGPQWLYSGAGAGRFAVQRDLAAEPVRAREATEALPLPAEEGPFCWVIPDPDAALELVHALEASALPVEWVDPSRKRRTARAGPGSLRLSVRRAREWLDVDGAVEVDGATVELSEVLAAVMAGRRFVAADDKTWVRLSDELTAQLGAMAVVGGEKLPTLAAPLVEELRAAGARVDEDVATRALLDRARGAATEDADVPATLAAELRPYQIEGFRWLSRLASWAPGACLADDMGLGKTVQAITFLLTRTGPTLVVAPTSVGFNWLREIGRFAPTLRARALRGAGRLDGLDTLAPDEVLVTSWDLLARDIETLEKIHFGTLVLDEAQAMKNPTTARAKAAARLDADFRLALTGTPVENRVSELWSLFRVVAPGLLGSWDRFRDRFAAPIEKDGDTTRRAALGKLIRPFLLRRLKTAVATELPPRTDVLVEIELSDDERRLYDATRLAALSAIAGPPEQRRFQVLAALTRLRQAACHPRLLDAESPLPSAKLTRLRELIAELRTEGHRALVFSQFTAHLALVREALLEDGVRLRYLDGSTPEARRRAEVDAFQAGDGEVFLISLKAGGVGLNLTAASYVFHLDPWWNPAVEDQASDRAHRIGQTMPVTVSRLVSRGTIEDKILALHEEKRALVSGLLEGTGEGAGLSVDELIGLLAD